MRGYLLITVLSISLSLTACKAKKVVTTEASQTNTAEMLSQAEAKAHQEQSLRVEDIFSTATLSEDIELTQTRTVYSPPDSTGRQYPVEQTETKVTNNRKLTTDNQQQTIDNRQQATESTKVTDNQQLATDNRQQTTKETPRGQAWKSWTAIIISLGIVILAYLLLRRFGLVKVKGGALGSIFKNN